MTRTFDDVGRSKFKDAIFFVSCPYSAATRKQPMAGCCDDCTGSTSGSRSGTALQVPVNKGNGEGKPGMDGAGRGGRNRFSQDEEADGGKREGQSLLPSYTLLFYEYLISALEREGVGADCYVWRHAFPIDCRRRFRFSFDPCSVPPRRESGALLTGRNDCGTEDGLEIISRRIDIINKTD